MLKGIFKLRPTFPRYTVTYDSDIILSYIDSLPPNNILLLEMLTKKLVTLLCLLSGQRSQFMGALDWKFSHYPHGKFTFAVPKIIKTTRQSKHLQPLEYVNYSANKKLCIVEYLLEYKELEYFSNYIINTKPEEKTDLNK